MSTKSKKGDSKEFIYFLDLHDDIQLNILSFLSDGPFSMSNNIYEMSKESCYRSTLTHVFPLTSRHFSRLLKSSEGDFLWRESLVRRMEYEPFLWCDGVIHVLAKWKVPLLTSNDNDDNEEKEITPDEILEAACKHYNKDPQDKSTKNAVSSRVHFNLFKEIITSYIRITRPVFMMQGETPLNRILTLHLFEPRYRIMISEMMSTFPSKYSRGEPIPEPYPTFLWANCLPMRESSPALLVELRRCQIFEDGRSYVFLMPCAHVWIEDCWVRPKSRNLHYANAVRMGEKASMFRERSFPADRTTIAGLPYQNR